MKKTVTKKDTKLKKSPEKGVVIPEDVLGNDNTDIKVTEIIHTEQPQGEAIQDAKESEVQEAVLQHPEEKNQKELRGKGDEEEKHDEEVSQEDVEDEEAEVYEEEKKPEFYERVMGEKPRAAAQVSEADGTEGSGGEEQPEIEKLNKKLFLLGGVVFLLTVVVTAIIGVFILNMGQNNASSSLQREVEEEPTPTEEPKKATIDRSEWKFEVLNGSGVAGAAADAADLLEELGYEVAAIGNADERVESTELYVKEEKENEQIDLLLDDLENDFGKLKVNGKLDNDEEFDARIIIGKE